jgi:di/tricarboxylate transporter
MTWEAWFTLGVAALTLICLAKDLLAPATVMIGAAIALLLGGIIKPEEAFAGFGNPAPVTVAALYVLARGAEKTGLLQPILERLLGRGGGGRWTLTRLLVPCSMASAFLNNTPIVAMMIPQVLRWAERTQESVARYLMPLSFAVVLGGVITTIGTSTNLVVSGLLQKSGGAPLGLFEIKNLPDFARRGGPPRRLQRARHLLARHPAELQARPRRPRPPDFRDNWDQFLWPLIVASRDTLKTFPLGLAQMEGIDSAAYHGDHGHRGDRHDPHRHRLPVLPARLRAGDRAIRAEGVVERRRPRLPHDRGDER